MGNDIRLQNGALSTTQVGTYNVYTGARYVPLIAGEWDITKNYEPLTIVINQGNSYTSGQYVPAGVPLQNNGPYWFKTGDFNGQLSSLENQVTENTNEIESLQTNINNIEEPINNVSDLPFLFNNFSGDMNEFFTGVKGGSYNLNLLFPSSGEYLYNAGSSNTLINSNAAFYVNQLLGVNIANGEIKSNDPSFDYGETTPTAVLAWKSDQKLVAIPNTTITSAQDLISQGYTNVIQGAYALIENGVSVYKGSDDGGRGWCGVGQKLNGDLVFYNSFENYNQAPQKKAPMIAFFLSQGCTFAYMFDGGGSAQISIMGREVTPPSLDRNYRKIYGIFNVESKVPLGNIVITNRISSKAMHAPLAAFAQNCFANYPQQLNTGSVRYVKKSGVFVFDNTKTPKAEQYLPEGIYLCFVAYDNINDCQTCIAVNETTQGQNIYLGCGVSSGYAWRVINIT